MVLKDRFELQADRSGWPGACHEWMGPRNAKGYGGFRVFRRELREAGITEESQLAHRVAFWMANGYWPKPMCLHLCSNPPCVNSHHLVQGDGDLNLYHREKLGRTL